MTEIKVFKDLPNDYHCTCKYCKDLFAGELKDEKGNYISARKREGYSPAEKGKHLCPGHWQGFKFVIEKFSNKKNVVLDPFSGTGTALVEAAKLGRKAIGCELEYYDILKENVKPYKGITAIEGDIRNNLDKIRSGSISLIVTGPPYNNTSDVPERKNLPDKKTGKKQDFTFNYKDKSNFAFLSDNEYYNEFHDLFSKLIPKLKKGGYFALIIKDPVRKKEAYLLHYHLSAILFDLGLIPEATYIHYHYPATLFMNTYPKKFPDVKIPKYQTIVVFKKK